MPQEAILAMTVLGIAASYIIGINIWIAVEKWLHQTNAEWLMLFKVAVGSLTPLISIIFARALISRTLGLPADDLTGTLAFFAIAWAPVVGLFVACMVGLLHAAYLIIRIIIVCFLAAWTKIQPFILAISTITWLIERLDERSLIRRLAAKEVALISWNTTILFLLSAGTAAIFYVAIQYLPYPGTVFKQMVPEVALIADYWPAPAIPSLRDRGPVHVHENGYVSYFILVDGQRRICIAEEDELKKGNSPDRQKACNLPGAFKN